MNNQDYQFGKYIAQIYSHDIARMLKAIYIGYVEPAKTLPSVCLGIIDEVETWNDLSFESKDWLSRLKK